MARFLESVAFVKKPRSCQTGVGQIPYSSSFYGKSENLTLFFAIYVFLCNFGKQLKS